MGFGPRLVDLNSDGRLDLLSGSCPGEMFWFRGGRGRTFAEPEMLKNRAGKNINVGARTPADSRPFDSSHPRPARSPRNRRPQHRLDTSTDVQIPSAMSRSRGSAAYPLEMHLVTRKADGSAREVKGPGPTGPAERLPVSCAGGRKGVQDSRTGVLRPAGNLGDA